MDGIEFITAVPAAPVDPARADIACFVGFIARRPLREREPGEDDAAFLSRLPEAVRDWLRTQGWMPGHDGRSVEDLVALNDVPVPIESWDAFDALFAWDERVIDEDATPLRCDTMLGAAVRSFFEEGGRRCYIVRIGDPWPVRAAVDVRRRHAASYLPSFPPVSATDRASWRGVGHLFGLPGVSFLCVPDLPDLFSTSARPRAPIIEPEGPEVFIECASRALNAEQRFLRGVPTPRCDETGFNGWAQCVIRLGEFLAAPAHRLREVQLVAAVPLPVDAASVVGERDSADRVHRATKAQWREAGRIRTAFVQLVYPWLRTRGSGMLPGNVLAPDGLFTGLLASSALLQGSWRSVLQHPVVRVGAVEPVLDRAALASPAGPRSLREHVSVIGPTPRGMRVLSDVTTDDDEVYRPGNVNRLVVAIIRAARIAGESVVFANHGEELWRRLREGLENLLAGFWSEGALLGATAREAFEVRCDRSTMTPADLDAGRLIVRVTFTAAHPIVQLTIVLAMDEGGHVTLASGAAQTLPAA